MREREIDRGGRVLRVRDAGDPGGAVVMWLHGTPGSRLWSPGEQLAAERGIRLVSFDRPGYGGSTPAPFGLASVAADAHAIADALGIGRFAILGISGGGPGALAAATVGGGRVSRVGIASGIGPRQRVPGAPELFDDTDRAALSLLPGDPAGAAAVLAAGVEPLAELIRTSGWPGMLSNMEERGAVTSRESELSREPAIAQAFDECFREAVRPGTTGMGWDWVCFLGEWDIDLSAVACPALLWYGSEEWLLPDGVWLSQNLPQAQLTVNDGEGHLGFVEHFGEMLDALTKSGTP